MKIAKLFLIIPAMAAGLSAAPILTESFADITTLAGSGWVQINNSAPVGLSGWFQGNPAVFPAHSGAQSEYVAANFESATLGGNISNWLILPALSLVNGDTLSFYTRSVGTPFPDRLEVRLNPTSSTDAGTTDASVGDFTILLLTVNPTLSAGGYPDTWTQYSVALSGLPVATQARLAFRYFVTDTDDNGDYMGIDTVSVDSGVALIPEPASMLLMGAGLAGLALIRRRR